MQIRFQTALITGSSRGLGRQIAVKLATEGVRKIAIHYRTGRSAAETTLSLIEAAGASGVLVQGDVAVVGAAESLVKEAAQKLGGCDIFVQSVVPPLGEVYEHVMSTELPLEKWQLAFDTQARAFFVCARTAATVYAGLRPGYRAVVYARRQDRGWQPWVGMGPAKAAIDSIGGYFAVALARYGVTVNMVNPGMSDAGLMLQTPREVQDAIKEWAESGWTPMRRRGSRTTLRTFARCSAAMRPGAAGRARALYSRAGDRLVLSVRSAVFFNRRPPLLRHSSASWSLWSENWIWTGRPPTAEEIEALVGPGTTGIGAINTSAVRCPIRTIAAILERHGMEPAPGNVAQAQRSVAA